MCRLHNVQVFVTLVSLVGLIEIVNPVNSNSFGVVHSVLGGTVWSPAR